MSRQALRINERIAVPDHHLSHKIMKPVNYFSRNFVTMS